MRDCGMSRVTQLFRKFGSRLMEVLQFKDVHCFVFLYLFERKVFAKDPKHSAYDIYKALNSQIPSFPLYKRKSISQRSVSEALDRLVGLGFVNREFVKESEKFHKKLKKPGRPPVCLYEAKSIQEVIEKIKWEIREKERRCMEVLDSLSVIEEAAETV